MIFLWQLFVLLALVFLLSPLMDQCVLKDVYGEKQLHYKWFPVLSLALPMIYISGTRRNIVPDFGDTTSYLMAFRETPASLTQLIAGFSEDTKDKGFSIFTSLVKMLIGNRETVYFCIIAAISILCVLITFKNYSCNFIISVFLFLASGDYIQWTFNGIRQFLAVSILFSCTGLLVKKKYISMIIIILLLSTIHASVLVFIPMIFIVQGKAWNKKTILFIGTVLMAILFLDQFTNLVTGIMENSQYSNEVDHYLQTEGTSIVRVIVYSMPALLTLILKKYVDCQNNKVINLATNMSICASLVLLLSSFTSGIFMGRLGILFSLYNYIVLPWIIEHSFTKKSTKIIYLIMVCLYLCLYYFQIHITWGL